MYTYIYIYTCVCEARRREPGPGAAGDPRAGRAGEREPRKNIEIKL